MEEENDLLSNINISELSFNIDTISQEIMAEDIHLNDVHTLQEEKNNEESDAIKNSNEKNDSNGLIDSEQGIIEEITENDIIQIQTVPVDENECEINNSKEEVGKRKRNKKPNKELWETEKCKAKRMKGEEYFGRRKNEDGKTVYDVKRSKRELKPRCLCKPKSKSVFQCHTVTEEIRKNIFNDFWLLNWEERRILAKQLVDNRSVSHRRVDSDNVRRKGSLYYHSKINQSQDRIRVCKKMFLNTLSMGEWAILNWVSTGSNRMEEQLNKEGTEIQGNTSVNDLELRSNEKKERKKGERKRSCYRPQDYY
ncbi:hypothetical protein J6590_108428 [Homalodisca vitripennis]|nr:hypothetical protein J6590_108428 [Homalodisca vitripennis]